MVTPLIAAAALSAAVLSGCAATTNSAASGGSGQVSVDSISTLQLSPEYTSQGMLPPDYTTMGPQNNPASFTFAFSDDGHDVNMQYPCGNVSVAKARSIDGAFPGTYTCVGLSPKVGSDVIFGQDPVAMQLVWSGNDGDSGDYAVTLKDDSTVGKSFAHCKSQQVATQVNGVVCSN